MRIDKYLWFTRIFKSRNLATNACKKDKVKINDQIVKPSSEVLPLDLIQIKRKQLWHSFKVLDHPKSRLGSKLVSLYCSEITNSSVIDKKKLVRLSAKVVRDQGTGRPTKKQLRDINEFYLNEE